MQSTTPARDREPCWKDRPCCPSPTNPPRNAASAASAHPVRSPAEARALAKTLGYPVIVKASMGGGGRGMRVAPSADQLDGALEQAQREAGSAFGIADVFLEKYVRRARHLEVQLLG